MDEIERADRGPWKVIDRRRVYQNPWIRLYEDQIISPRGNAGVYGWIQMPGAAGVVAIDANRNVHLVGQHRFAINQFIFEVPAGGLRKGENPLIGAQRELREETGITAQRWTSLGLFYPMSGVSNETFHLFLAEELDISTSNPDADEELMPMVIPLDEVLKMVQNSQIADALTCIAIYRAWHHLLERGTK